MPLISYPTFNQVIDTQDDLLTADKSVAVYDDSLKAWKLVKNTADISIPPIDGLEILNIYVRNDGKIVIVYDDGL